MVLAVGLVSDVVAKDTITLNILKTVWEYGMSVLINIVYYLFVEFSFLRDASNGKIL